MVVCLLSGPRNAMAPRMAARERAQINGDALFVNIINSIQRSWPQERRRQQAMVVEVNPMAYPPVPAPGPEPVPEPIPIPEDPIVAVLDADTGAVTVVNVMKHRDVDILSWYGNGRHHQVTSPRRSVEDFLDQPLGRFEWNPPLPAPSEKIRRRQPRARDPIWRRIRRWFGQRFGTPLSA